MLVELDGSELGEVTSLQSFQALVGDEVLDHIVFTRRDGVDTTLDEVLDQPDVWQSTNLELFTFDGWIDESASVVRSRLDLLRVSAADIAVMADNQSPIELLDQLMLKPKEILAELIGVAPHLGAEAVESLESIQLLMSAAETVITLAVRGKDFVSVADAVRLEWSIALRSLVGFLDPGCSLEMPPTEVGTGLDADDLYAKNLKAIGERFTDLVSQIEAAWDGRDQQRYALKSGPSGLRSPHINGHRMWSLIEPAADLARTAKEHAPDSSVERWDSAATWGVPGDLAFALLGEEMKDRPQIYVRPDLAAFAAELHCVDWRELLAAENTILCTTVTDYRWTMRNCFVSKDRMRRLSSPNLLNADPALYVELHEESGQTELTLAMEDFTGGNRGRQWTTNALANVPALLEEPDATALHGLRQGLPGILVAPGPSLQKNIHLIPEFAKKGVVVGVSHVLGKLQDLGVDPELIVAIEANDISSHFDGTDPSKTSLFLHESTHPNVVNQPAIQRWVVHDGEIGRRLRKDEDLRSVRMVASSCTHIAMWALKELGCDPIVFVGLDLALEDGNQYSKGCEGSTPAQSSIEVEGYCGGIVQTIAQYAVFRDQFELCLTHPTFQGREFINATEGGAKIRGVKQQNLSEVLEELADRPEKAETGGLAAPESAIPTIEWPDVIASLETSAEQMSEAEKSAQRGLKSAKLALDCFKLGDEAGMSRRGRAASKRARRANEILTVDHVLNGRWMAAQNKRSNRLEREASYLKDDPKALMYHNLMHYQQLLSSLEEATRTLKPHYEEAAERVKGLYDV